MPPKEYETRQIRHYILLELGADTRIERLERLSSVRLMGEQFETWEVESSKGSWWVLTNPTSVYSKEKLRGAEDALLHHLGSRVYHAAQARLAGSLEERLLPRSWRRLRTAHASLEAADEAEDMQAVGMRCRECLLELIEELRTPEMVSGGTSPREADFRAWSGLIADYLASGSQVERLRAWLKSEATELWQYVSWLTHARRARRLDAEIAVQGTAHLLTLFALGVNRRQQGEEEKCPRCGSYRLTTDFRPEGRYFDNPSVVLCEACGWEHRPEWQWPRLVRPSAHSASEKYEDRLDQQ